MDKERNDAVAKIQNSLLEKEEELLQKNELLLEKMKKKVDDTKLNLEIHNITRQIWKLKKTKENVCS